MVVVTRTSWRRLAMFGGALAALSFVAEPALAEPGGSFLNPSHSLPASARASRGVAEQSIRAYRQEESSPSDQIQKRPPQPPVQNGSQPTSPMNESAEENSQEEAEENEEEIAEEAPPSFLPAHWHQLGGINWSVLYTGEVFNNMRGGITTRNATRYRGNTDIVFTYDTEANQLWDGGQFFVYGSNTHGHTLTQDFIGDYQFYSNIDSTPHPNLMQVSEYWYLHKCADGLLSFKIGKADANADFAYVDIASNFINSSFALSPNIALPTWPNQALGAIALYQPREKLLLSCGIYDGGSDGRMWGFNTIGSNGAFVIGQAMWTPQFGPDEDMPGTYRFGVWHHSGKFAFVDENEAYDTNFIATCGFYVNMEQMIWKEVDEQGLGVFSQFSYADGPDRFNRVDLHWSLGLVYRGLFSNRDEDVFGVGITNVNFHNGTAAVTDRTYEEAIEMFYRFQLTPWASIQPDFQYICNPSGNGNDAFIGGFRFQTAF